MTQEEILAKISPARDAKKKGLCGPFLHLECRLKVGKFKSLPPQERHHCVPFAASTSRSAMRRRL